MSTIEEVIGHLLTSTRDGDRLSGDIDIEFWQKIETAHKYFRQRQIVAHSIPAVIRGIGREVPQLEHGIATSGSLQLFDANDPTFLMEKFNAWPQFYASYEHSIHSLHSNAKKLATLPQLQKILGMTLRQQEDITPEERLAIYTAISQADRVLTEEYIPAAQALLAEMKASPEKITAEEREVAERVMKTLEEIPINGLTIHENVQEFKALLKDAVGVGSAPGGRAIGTPQRMRPPTGNPSDDVVN